jgi:hypothetical protein
MQQHTQRVATTYSMHGLRHYQLYPLPLVQGVVQTVVSEYHYLTSESCSCKTLLRHSVYLTPTQATTVVTQLSLIHS